MRIIHAITGVSMMVAYGILVTKEDTHPAVMITSTIAVCTGMNLMLKNLVNEWLVPLD